MRQKNGELISVVVPVYNVESYLPHCVDTILKQTYTNIEVFLVDDGSTDSSGIICEELAELDNRIKVIRKNNGGLSDARNVAIEKANGEYITFIDSDDYIPYDSLEYLYSLIREYNADISIGKMLLTSETNELRRNQETQILKLENKEAVKEMLYGSYYTASASGKLYKSSLFKNVRYPYGKLNEDLFTTYKVLDKANLTICSNKIVYYYFHRNGSIMNSAFSYKKLDVLQALNQINKDIELYDYGAQSAFSALTLSTAVAVLALRPEKKYIKEYDIWYRIKKNRYIVLRDKRCNRRIKAYAALSFFGKGVLTIIYNLYYKMKWK